MSVSIPQPFDVDASMGGSLPRHSEESLGSVGSGYTGREASREFYLTPIYFIFFKNIRKRTYLSQESLQKDTPRGRTPHGWNPLIYYLLHTNPFLIKKKK